MYGVHTLGILTPMKRKRRFSGNRSWNLKPLQIPTTIHETDEENSFTTSTPLEKGSHRATPPIYSPIGVIPSSWRDESNDSIQYSPLGLMQVSPFEKGERTASVKPTVPLSYTPSVTPRKGFFLRTPPTSPYSPFEPYTPSQPLGESACKKRCENCPYTPPREMDTTEEGSPSLYKGLELQGIWKTTSRILSDTIFQGKPTDDSTVDLASLSDEDEATLGFPPNPMASLTIRVGGKKETIARFPLPDYINNGKWDSVFTKHHPKYHQDVYINVAELTRQYVKHTARMLGAKEKAVEMDQYPSGLFTTTVDQSAMDTTVENGEIFIVNRSPPTSIPHTYWMWSMGHFRKMSHTCLEGVDYIAALPNWLQAKAGKVIKKRRSTHKSRKEESTRFPWLRDMGKEDKVDWETIFLL